MEILSAILENNNLLNKLNNTYIDVYLTNKLNKTEIWNMNVLKCILFYHQCFYFSSLMLPVFLRHANHIEP